MAGLPARGKKTYHGLQSAVAQHLQDLSVLLPVLLKGKLTLLITVVRLGQYKPGSGGWVGERISLVLVLSSAPVLSSFSLVLRHSDDRGMRCCFLGRLE